MTEPKGLFLVFAVLFSGISLASTFLKPWRPDTDPLSTGFAWALSTAGALIMWLAVLS
jgi:hypothetical protein